MRRDLYHIANEAMGELLFDKWLAIPRSGGEAFLAGRIMEHYDKQTRAYRRALREGRIARATALADELQKLAPAVRAWVRAKAYFASLKATAEAHGRVWKWPPVLDDC